MALCDTHGRIRWCNSSFERLLGFREGASLLDATLGTWHAGRSRDRLLAGFAGHARARRRIRSMRCGRRDDLGQRARQLQRTGATLDLCEHQRAPRNECTCDRVFGTPRTDPGVPRARHLGARPAIGHRPLGSRMFEFYGLDPGGGTPSQAELAARFHPQDVDPFFAESLHRAGRYARRFRIVKADGSICLVHSQWLVKASPDGHPLSTLGVMVDATEAYDLARSRDAADAKLRVVLELVDIAVWRHDFATDLVSYNEHGSRFLGLPLKPDGITLADLRVGVHPDDVPKLAAAARASAAGEPTEVQVRHRRSDGSWRDLLIRRAIERDTGGKPVAASGVIARRQRSNRAGTPGRAPDAPPRSGRARRSARHVDHHAGR